MITLNPATEGQKSHASNPESIGLDQGKMIDLNNGLSTRLAPVALFVYKRIQETSATLHALRENHLASKTDLIVFGDAARTPSDQTDVIVVRELFKDLQGFRSVKCIWRERNLGLARSIILGVSEILEESGRVIVLEDDLITSPNFLDFMNQALEHYSSIEKVFAVSAYSYPLWSTKLQEDDVSFSYRSISWGWGTWLDRWRLVDWEVQDYPYFLKDRKAKRELSKGGSDLFDMLARQQAGLIDSWMIRWVYAQRKHRLLDVFPKISKIRNIGFGANATHTRGVERRFKTNLDQGFQRHFHFSNTPRTSKLITLEIYWKWSILRRLYYKIHALISRADQRKRLLREITMWLCQRLGLPLNNQ